MVPRAVLMKSGLVSVNTARQVNTAYIKATVNGASPVSNLSKTTHSTVKRPIHKNTSFKNSNFNQRVNTVKDKKFNTARPKEVFNAARPKAVVNAVKGNNVNAVKASACWIMKRLEVTPKEGKSQAENSVLFNDTECIVLSPNFKLTDESHVLLKVPRKNNMYSVDLKTIVPKGGLTCLFAKATSDESELWHMRLRYINFKTMNKLVKGNFVRGLPLKLFENNQTCVACQKGKQHRASCKSKTVSSISQPLHMLHMDLFGPTFVKSLMKKMYCLVVTDAYSRYDNGTEFKNKEMNQFCERKAESKLPTTFWAEAVNTTCYVQNRVLVTKPHNKTPYELFLRRKPALGFMRPFGCPVTILNTIDHLGKFDDKTDEGFFVGYSINSKAFRVFSSRTRIVEENLHVQFSENTPNIAGGCQFLRSILISWDCKEKKLIHMVKIHADKNVADLLTKAFDATVKVRTVNREQKLQALVDGKKKVVTEASVRRDLQLDDEEGTDCLPNTTIFEELTRIGPRKPKKKDTEIPQSSILVENVADEAVYKEMDDSLERATTIATGLDVEHDRGNISKTQSKATPNEPSSIRTSSGGGPRRQDTMGDTIAQTRSENVSKFSNDLLLAGVNTPRSGEDSLQLKELIDFCTKLQQRVLDLENTKTAQAQEITSLKKRVKKLERKKKSRTHGLKRLYKVGLSARIDSLDDEASLGDQEDASKQGRKIHDIDVDKYITLDSTHFDTDPDMFGVHDLDVQSVSAAKDLSDVDMTLAQALAELKSTKPKAVTTAATTTTTAVTRPKAKGLVIQEQEQASTPITSSKDKGKGIMEERIAREKEEANAALIAQWNDIQDKVETDYELAQRLQAEEQEELTIEEKSKLFQQLLEKRRKHFAAKRAEERRNRPPTKAQQRSIICTYLKNMAGWKPKDLKTNETREESSSKRAGDELEQEPSKKQKVDDDKETKELKQCMEIISDDGDDVTIEATPLSTKSPTIVDYKIYKEGKKSYFQIIRADGNSQMYLTFGKMLKNFDKEDLEVL
ncbi:putative ribonuclease H-like domain-containing protein [Tanacetum coccineum]